MMHKRQLIGTLFLGMFCFICSGGVARVSAQATSFTVCPSGNPGTNGCNYIGSDGIQQAIDAIPNGTESLPNTIVLRPGTYLGVAARIGTGEHPVKQHIEIRGDSARSTILKGEDFWVFEILNSVVRFSNITISDAGLSGLIVDGASQVHLSNLVVENNGGSGIEVWANSRITIANSVLSLNQYEAILMGENATASILNNIISGNWGGIGIYGNSQATIANNEITGDLATGIELFADAQATISNNFIGHNKQEGILIRETAQATIANNTVVGNIWDGINCSESSVCHVFNNISINNQIIGIIANQKSNFATFKYNISWGSGEGNFNHFYSPEELQNNHNVSFDPQFVSSTDFHLLPSSSAKDAGDPTVLDPDGSRSDMGMYGGPGACGSDFALTGCTLDIDVNNDGLVNIQDYQKLVSEFTNYSIQLFNALVSALVR